MGLRPGYKKTEVGVIPEDWELHTVGRMGEVVIGKALAADSPGEQRPYLRTKNVFDGRIDIEDVLTMPMTDAEFRHFMIIKGDVLLNEGQSLELVGRCAMYGGEYPQPCAIQNQLLRFRAQKGVSGTFASQLFRYSQRTGVFARVALRTTSIAHLGGKRFEKLLLAWPPTEAEQHAIAKALSDLDELLSAIGQLIVKKHDLKQAFMQQLLTGQARLPGFSGEWEAKRLGSHLTFLKNGMNSRAELTVEDGVDYLHYGDIHGAVGLLLNPSVIVMPHLPISKAGQLDRLMDGDLVFADASEDLDGVGKAVELHGVEQREVVSGLHTIAVRFDKKVLADGFKAYLQFVPGFRQHLRRLAAGTKVYATSRAHIATAELSLPGVKEQTAIAAVLSDLNAEIEALEARQSKTRDIKQAMMQELLTGKTRLVQPKAAYA